MAKYDVHRVFEDIPRILGMDLVKRGQQWEGGYYLTGERHPHRREKLKVVKWNNDIWLHEEGGNSISLINWLLDYGGAADKVHALEIIRGHQVPLRVEPVRARHAEELLYVSNDVMYGLAQYDLAKCSLFRWMCTLFPEDKVREAWSRFGVTTDKRGNAVFWFRDADGHLLHDKRMCYKEDGHRNRDFGAWREFTIAKGYRGRCFFGEWTWKKEPHVYCCESEKTALLFYLYYGKPIIATGGKNAITSADERIVLVPDMDAREEWEQKGAVWKWWNKFPEVGDHDDIGDAIVKRLKNRK